MTTLVLLNGPPASGKSTIARRLAVAMATEHLASGSEVIVPQFLARTEFMDRLAETASTCGARFAEITLDRVESALVDIG
jgi:cytidylate kinase